MPVLNRRETTKGAERALARVKTNDRRQVIELARKHTARAIQKLVDLMDGKGGKVWVLSKEGQLVQIDVEVPAAVQAACAEKLLERGHGKNPQAILIQEDSPEGRRTLSVVEKIEAIRAAREGRGQTTDLEASEIIEIRGLPEPAPAEPATTPNPHDFV